MKTLNKYITEKLQINKKLKMSKDAHAQEFLVVEAYNDVFDELEDDWLDAMIASEIGSPNIFVMPSFIGEDYIDKDDCKVYKIPEKYDELSDFIKDYEVGDITLEDLEEA